MKNTGIKRLCIDALFASVALIIFVIELQIPNLTPIPGIKLGLANIVILLSLYLMGPVDALIVQLARILLGCLITGNMVSLAYSLTGGMLCLVVMIILKKFLNENQIWACSAAGAIFHNIGQIIVAIVMTSVIQVVYYLPILIASGIIAGLLTGISSQLLVKQMKKHNFWNI